MKHVIKRSALLTAAASAAVMVMSMVPAHAAGAGAFVGTAHIACFGCGHEEGDTADLQVVGVNGTTPVVLGGVSATYHVDEAAALCPLSGSAGGSTTGAITVDFTWTRVGAVAIITSSGDINGAGVAAFVVTAPVGLPCNGSVDATVVGALAGT